MKKLLVLLFILPFSLFAQDFPERPQPPRLVNDFADMIGASEEQQLESKLVAYYDTTSTQIAVVTITSIGQYDASSYSFELANKWGIGRKSKNNGILLLVVKESRDVFIATGYGTEEFVPDAVAKRITEQILVPQFKEGQFYAGIDEATDAIFGRLTGKFVNEDQGKGKRKGKGDNRFVLIIVVVIIIIVMMKRRGGGGMGGGRRSIFFGPGMGWGGFSSGGFSSGGGSFGGGGGFGGFGGGSFGGGGAGGKW